MMMTMSLLLVGGMAFLSDWPESLIRLLMFLLIKTRMIMIITMITIIIQASHPGLIAIFLIIND